MNIEASVRARRSVRTFVNKPLTTEDREKLCAYAAEAVNPFELPIEFRMLEGMSSPVIVGTDLFIGGKLKKASYMNEAFGYSFEKIVLYAQSLGIGTTWIGGTMDRGAFERKMELAEDEIMPCVSPIGYPSEKMSLRESMMRKGVKAESRMDFEEIFYDGSFAKPLTKERAGDLFFPLEMVRLAPSAVNKQPWRIVIADNTAHFYLQRSKGFNAETLDMQKVDIGIAMCHFDLAVQSIGYTTELTFAEPMDAARSGQGYIASFRIGK